eukprot:scaffold89861_cov75-Phaeocystis_antarctica.AAC.2
MHRVAACSSSSRAKRASAAPSRALLSSSPASSPTISSVTRSHCARSRASSSRASCNCTLSSARSCKNARSSALPLPWRVASLTACSAATSWADSSAWMTKRR